MLNIHGATLNHYQSLNWKDSSIYTSTLFDKAEHESLSLLRLDPFRRFQSTEEFKNQYQRFKSENENILMVEVIAPPTQI